MIKERFENTKVLYVEFTEKSEWESELTNHPEYTVMNSGYDEDFKNYWITFKK